MHHPKRTHPIEKLNLHPRNRHRNRYDFKLLTGSSPDLAQFVRLNPYGDESIDFHDPMAVKALNKALLKFYYDIDYWDIPVNYLCPPIPGRADYIHHIAGLLGDCNQGIFPAGPHIRCLDIGVGANCIYPIIGAKEYGWSFVGSDIDPVALASAQRIVASNPILEHKVELRLQRNSDNIFEGIIKKDERFDLTLCNPPFHASKAEAQAGTLRKIKNLSSGKVTQPILNFGGQQNELWCEGGEVQFVQYMVGQSKQFSGAVMWFSTLVSRESTLKYVYNRLKQVDATEVRTIPMSQGNKISRIVAWTFLQESGKRNWINPGWKR